VNVSDRAAGSTLEGRYRLEARLSNWGIGEVWRAADTQRARASVTVKLLPAPTSRRTERMAALRLLGDRLGKLQHPNVLPLVEVHTSGAQPFVVYESWEGIGLGEWLTAARATGEPTSLRTVLGIADRVLAAVGAGHRQRSPGSLIHGAIHHEAVRVRVEEGREPEVRVLDFGLGAEKDSSALAALVDSTPSEYAAPEHAREPSLRNPAADVFAAAVLILRLLVPEAVRPRGHRSWAHFVTQRESEVHSAITALRADVHPSVWEALAQALSRRPEARPADAERLRELLRAASWGVPSSMDAPGEALAPVVPMALPTLQPIAPPVASLSLSAPLGAPLPMPTTPAPAARPAGPPPVPKGMQLGVGSVLGANRPDSGSVRPRRATAGVDHRNFGPLAPRPMDADAPPAPRPGHVSVDDAQSTRQDIELPSDEPATVAESEMTMAVNIPVASPSPSRSSNPQIVSIEQANRTVRSPFDHVEHTQIAQLPLPPSAPMPPHNPSAPWSAGPSQPFASPSAGAYPATLPLPFAEATMPLDVVPPEVAAALAAYAAPVNPASWDSTSNLQPVSLPAYAAPSPPRYAPPPSYAAPAARAADPFALVAAAGRGDARAWDANTTPPDQSPAPARRYSTAMLIGLALLAAALAFLVGVLASNRGAAAAPVTVAPTTR
jgi:serine/threonine protein kinase